MCAFPSLTCSRDTNPISKYQKKGGKNNNNTIKKGAHASRQMLKNGNHDCKFKIHAC